MERNERVLVVDLLADASMIKLLRQTRGVAALVRQVDNKARGRGPRDRWGKPL